MIRAITFAYKSLTNRESAYKAVHNRNLCKVAADSSLTLCFGCFTQASDKKEYGARTCDAATTSNINDVKKQIK